MQHVYVNIGQVKTDTPPAEIITVLGSCVAVLIYDPVNQVAGLVHIAEHEGDEKAIALEPGRYANSGIRLLIQSVLSAGGKRNNFVCIISGGNYTTSCRECVLMTTDVSRLNRDAVRRTLTEEGLSFTENKFGADGAASLVFDVESHELRVTIQETKYPCDKCHAYLEKHGMRNSGQVSGTKS